MTDSHSFWVLLFLFHYEIQGWKSKQKKDEKMKVAKTIE